MFKKKLPEQQIIVEAEKLGSMKESLEALSWGRVAEIAKELQEDVSEVDRHEFGRELLAISQANSSLLGKLGISSESFSGQVMSSGIEMLEGGIATESFEPEEPKRRMNSSLDSEESSAHLLNSHEAKIAALGFLYEDISHEDVQVDAHKDVSLDNLNSTLTELINLTSKREKVGVGFASAEKNEIALSPTDVFEVVIDESIKDELRDGLLRQKAFPKGKRA